MKPNAILIAAGLTALVHGESPEDSLIIAQEVACQVVTESVDETILRCLNRLIELADQGQVAITLDLFGDKSGLKKLNAKKRVALQQLFMLQGRSVFFTKDSFVVYPFGVQPSTETSVKEGFSEIVFQTLNNAGEQADLNHQLVTIPLSEDEDNGLFGISEQEGLILERVFAQNGRTINFFLDRVTVHPRNDIERRLKLQA